MRIALDGTPLLGPRTGVAAFVAGLLGALVARTDVEVSAYGVTWRGRDDLAGAVPAGVATGGRPMAARPLRWSWQRMAAPPIEWWTGPIDVVHGTNFVVPPSRRAAAVVTVHDLTFLHFPELCDAATLAYPSLLRAAIERGALVHAVSQFVADEVVEHLGVDPDRVGVAHSGVPPVGSGDAARGRHLAGSASYVLAVGMVEPRKDLPLLVRAFDAVAPDRPGLGLVIAGPDGWGADALARAIAAASCRERIVRLGWVDDADRSALLAGATVLAYPSRYEGFGFPPLEAMAAGVPVVATAAGALPEVVGDAAALVPVGDGDALAGALARVLDDPGRRDALVAAGLQRVARYRWDRCAEGLMALYHRAAGA
ncbi:MAG: glycosyltransferase family 4 protein [Actinobacteria bacterium]|nr:glycosyltransferase family 4 protein [Actinomycetota bacterium]